MVGSIGPRARGAKWAAGAGGVVEVDDSDSVSSVAFRTGMGEVVPIAEGVPKIRTRRSKAPRGSATGSGVDYVAAASASTVSTG